jgi:hypothetical protein
MVFRYMVDSLCDLEGYIDNQACTSCKGSLKTTCLMNYHYWYWKRIPTKVVAMNDISKMRLLPADQQNCYQLIDGSIK